MTRHWVERVAERIGPDVCPAALWSTLRAEIDRGDSNRVEYLGRQGRGRRRLWRFTWVDGRAFVAVTTGDITSPITVYEDAE